MRHQFRPTIAHKQNTRRVISLLIVLVLFIFAVPHSSADILLHNKQALLLSNEVSAVTQYNISFTFPEPSTYGSLKIEVCANDPVPNTTCVPPGGFDLSNAILSSQTGPVTLSIQPGSTSNMMILGGTPTPAIVQPVSYTLDQVVNPSSAGTFFIRMQTYASADGTGTEVFQGGIALLTSINIPITATVPPYLTFCTGVTISGFNCANAQGDFIDFGELSSSKTSHGTSQMLASTNAQSGYNVTLLGSTMVSGNNEIPALTAGDVSRPGTSQFGMNLTANSTPAGGSLPTGPGAVNPVSDYSTANTYRFVKGETLVSTNTPDDVRLFTASYIVNIANSQPAGIYVTTITYICLATF